MRNVSVPGRAILQVTLICLVTVLAGEVASQEPPLVQAPVFHRHGVPLAEVVNKARRLGPVVVVTKDTPNGAGLVRPPSPMRQLEWMTSLVPVVVIARIETVTPGLTPARDWVVSQVQATVLEVLKKPDGDSLAVGSRLDFAQDGGELVLDGISVRTRVPYSHPHEAGRRYLLFVDPARPVDTRVYEPTSYLITESNELRSLATSNTDEAARSETGVALADAIRRIRAVKKNLRQPSSPVVTRRHLSVIAASTRLKN
jgi:hypothetical protein